MGGQNEKGRSRKHVIFFEDKEQKDF